MKRASASRLGPRFWKSFGAPAWDATNDPLKLDYRVTPPPIADWVANIPLIDLDALEKLSADKILDDELIAAAREFETKVIPDHSDGQELE